ncbi:MAG: hypothetical protein IJF83_00055 [Methanobrevibacter sp.]|nr:hypothetical protein [Methanobrevibacter sp.]
MGKYVYRDNKNNVFRISRRINGKQLNFGTYPTQEEANLAVELYEKHGWNKENNWAIKAQVKEIMGDSYGAS